MWRRSGGSDLDWRRKKPKIQRRFWHGRSCVFETTLKRKKFGAFNTRNTFPRVAKILYRSSSRQWTAIKNLQWNYLKGRILLQANNKLLVSPLQLLSGSIIILSPAFKVCIQDSILWYIDLATAKREAPIEKLSDHDFGVKQILYRVDIALYVNPKRCTVKFKSNNGSWSQ